MADATERAGMASFSVFLLLVALAAVTGSVFQPGVWYEGLRKPAWTPPNAVFPVAWSLLYLMIAVAGWRLWRAAGWSPALRRWAGQLALNAAWTPVVFGAHALGPGFGVIALLWVSIAATALAAARVDRGAALLLLPYLGWVTYAAALNFALWRANAV